MLGGMGRAALITLIAASSVWGCAHGEGRSAVAVTDPVVGPASSLVFDAATLRTAREEAPPLRPPGVEAWYAARLDNRESVAAGYQSPVVQRVVTRSYDQRGSTLGFVYDDSFTTTYREEIQEGVR